MQVSRDICKSKDLLYLEPIFISIRVFYFMHFGCRHTHLEDHWLHIKTKWSKNKGRNGISQSTLLH